MKLTVVTCGTCGKPRGLRHACVTSATSPAQRRKDAAARRKTAEKARRDAARKPRPPRQPRHDYRTCTDEDCARYGCIAYREGIDDCPLSHGV